jgi:two-component system, chemotaxis family, chemotaxis protein CheY
MRALIVEDDPISSEILQNVLSAYGHCDMAADGRAALSAFQRSLDEASPYDLICMDIMMPELSGQEALRSIRDMENRAGVPAANAVKVIMTTALSETSEAADALFKGGACAYFVKPIQIDNFIGELKRIRVIPE